MADLPRDRRAKTPTVLQMEAVECGAAALAMVLGHYGKFIALEELRLACGVSRDGSKASNVVRAARSYGMESKGFRKEPHELRELPLPQIVFWNFNHFVVVEGFKGNQVFLNDPASGPRVVSAAEFDESFTGVVLTFKPTSDFQPSGSPPSSIEALSRRFKGASIAVTFLIMAGLGLVIPGLVIPVFTKVFVDNILVGRMESWFKPLLIGMILTAILRIGLTWLQKSILLRLRTKLALATASKFMWHVLRLPVEFYTQRSPGEISSRIAINDHVAQLLSGDLANAVLNVMTAAFFVIIMFFYDPVLTLVSIAVVAINMFALRAVARKRRTLNQRLAIDSGKVMGASMNGLMVIETLKSSGSEADFFAKWSGYQAKFMNSLQEMERSALFLNTLPAMLTAINTALILAIGGLRVMDGMLTMGMLVAYQSLMQSFTQPVNDLVHLGGQLQEAQGDMDRLDDVERYKIDPSFDTDPEEAAVPPAAAKLEGCLELKNINFGYSRLSDPLIENFNLSLKPGQRIALVGSSGCGKSTLSKLVMEIYQAWSGEVLFDGKPRSAYPRLELANSLAMVDQDIMLFEGTVRENLTMWDSTIPEADILQAAQDAEIHSVIASRPCGYDSLVEEGGKNFSGGQRQRLEIARALVTNPRLLVLDEATSALDPLTEQKIDSNLRRRGCTCLIVAHRLSTIRDCDEIIVLAFGRVMERGTHDALMAIEDGHYRRLIGAE